MSKIIKIKKGLDIPLKGVAKKKLSDSQASQFYALKPTDFHGLTPKLSVKVGAKVKAGSTLFIDKYKPLIRFCSPVSGTIEEIRRGERRRILEIVVRADEKIEYEKFDSINLKDANREELKTQMLTGGVWPFVRQRPYDVIADPATTPRDIFISGFDTAPLAASVDFIASKNVAEIQLAIDALTKLTNGKVWLGLQSGDTNSSVSKLNNVSKYNVSGRHPAGNVGVQIHHLSPINKGDLVWTVNVLDLIIIGRLFSAQVFDTSRVVAVAGDEALAPQYFNTRIGATINTFAKSKSENAETRYISGNVLTGTKVEASGFLSFYSSQVTIIPEGNKHEFLGWALPGLNKFSTSRSFFSWLTPKRKYSIDANYHGGERAFIMTGEYEKVVPIDVLPVHLLKAILVDDIDAMEQLGIYEVIPEDFALCDFVCTSKIETQEILRQGLDLMIKEMS